MSTRYLPPGTLIEDAAFRRWLGWSAGAHLLAAMLWLVAPISRQAFIPAPPVFVELVASAGRPAARPAPRRQIVDEPVVIPKQPKPEPKPKPKVEPKPKAEPKPKVPPPSAEELLARLRKKVDARTPAAANSAEAASETGRGSPRGRLDPEMAAYERKLKALLYANWAGARAFRGQDDLVANFKVTLDPSGAVHSVSLVGSSGNRYFDESSERAIWKTRPFPPPPRGALVLTVTVDPKESL